MSFWQKKLKPVPPPSVLIGLADLFFILLAVFVLRARFVYLPGIRSMTLPVLKNAEVISAEKHIITVSFDRRENPRGRYVYTFNDEVRNDLADMESSIREALRLPEAGMGRRQLLVLVVEKDVPYEELVNIYAFARKFNVELLLATGGELQENTMRMSSQPQEK